jgi:methionyl-tRNA formyltransferase
VRRIAGAAGPRVLFFGNSDGAFSNRHFAALLACPCQVVGVVDVPPARRASTSSASGPRSFAAEARERGIPVFEPARPNAEGFPEEAAKLAPDLILAVGYLLRLGDALLALPRAAAANFHASLLPAYRGKHPVFWALRNGERWCGMSVHTMDAGLDTGEIIFQVRVRVRRGDSVTSLYERIMDRSVALVGRLVACVARGAVPRRPQAEAGASYFSAVSEADFRLDWSSPAETLRRWITISPGQCWSPAAGARVFFTGAETVRRRGTLPAPGTIAAAERGACLVACADGFLRLRQARAAGGAQKPAAQTLADLGLDPGSRIGT